MPLLRKGRFRRARIDAFGLWRSEAVRVILHRLSVSATQHHSTPSASAISPAHTKLMTSPEGGRLV